MQRSRNWLGLVLLVICFLVLSLRPASAQSVVGHQIDHGPTLPTTCSASKGQIYFVTSGTVGLYGCKTDNTWTVTGGGFAFVGVLASIPATCTVGDLSFITNATAGQNIYECAATNTWTQQLNSGSGGASTALDNLASVSINTSLLAQTGTDLGSTTKPFRNLFLFGAGTYATTYLKLTGTPTSTRTWTFPDVTDTVAGLGIANTFTTTQTVSPATDVTAISARVKAAGTADVIQLFQNDGSTNAFKVGSTGNVTAAGSVTTGSGGLITGGTVGSWTAVEGTAPSGVAASDVMYADSTAHRFVMKNNNGSALNVVASGTDINTSDQVTVTHLAAALPVAQGGTALASGTSGGILGYTASGTLASSGALTVNVLTKGGGAGATPTNSLITDNGTTSTYTGTGGYVAPLFVSNGANAGYVQCTQGTAQGHATANTITDECPASVTAYEIVKPGAAASGIRTWTNAASVVTESITATSGSGNVALTTSAVLTTPNVTTIKDANAAPFIASSATASAVDSITVTNAATANPATVTLASSGSDSNINLSLDAVGAGVVKTGSKYFQATSNKVTMTADWTCGSAGTSTSCTAATIVGTNGTPLTLTLPLQALSWHLHCEGVVGQATAATANQWNLLTATNGATNVTASYVMGTAATATAWGAITDQAATTTTFQIAPSWTLGGTATKMPFKIDASIEGASASGTVVSLQLLAPTAADVVTIYRGAFCSVSTF